MKLSAPDAMLLTLSELGTAEPVHRLDLFHQVWKAHPGCFTFKLFPLREVSPCSKTMNETLADIKARGLVRIARRAHYALTEYGEARVRNLREALAGIPTVPS